MGGWLSPLVHLSNNPLSLAGVVLVTTAAVFWFFLLPVSIRSEVDNPYMGILIFMLLPGVFFLGLLLIPAGILFRLRGERKRGTYPADFPALNMRNIDFRRLVVFVGAATVVNVIIAAQTSYSAVNYMDSVTFCGQTCHSVMEPEFAAYQNSPHSRVECVKCHIGPGASWFVRSKLSGVWQVFAVTFNTYDRPIPTPVRNLRPARDTCETCHWPQKFGADRLRIIDNYADDEANTRTRTVLLMKIGGGSKRGPGIHGMHLDPGVVIRYAHSDESRQTIPWVEYRDTAGRVTTYLAEGVTPEQVKNYPVREMDCMDCHNRPTHAFSLPERAVNEAISNGEVSPSLPYIKKTAVELLKAPYASSAEAEQGIRAGLEKFYREGHPESFQARRAEIQRAADSIIGIYRRNVFPTMRVTWGNYPNNIGHMDFPGCFRCHDDQHKSADGATVRQDCSSCHQILAMDEAAPKILADLGLETASGQQ